MQDPNDSDQPMPAPASSPDPAAQLKAATGPDGHIHAINPKGDLVRMQPGSVRLAASVEKGTYLAGLKDGWHLATHADLEAKRAAAAAAEEKNPRGEPSPKRGGA